MTLDDVLVPKSSNEFTCKFCDYTCCRKSQYDRHCFTNKHKRITDGLQNGTESSSYRCECGKHFKYRQGLHKHRQVCKENNTLLSSERRSCSMLESTMEKTVIDTALFMEIIKQNKDLQNLLAQQAADYSQKQSELMNKLVEREPGNNNTVVNNTTNNHQKFNLNFFLNETCKDAMNIQEFLENIRITFENLLTIGDSGFVNGVSDILIKQLRSLDVSKRPIHCTDAKRETIYVKDQDRWNKDDKENSKLKDAIQKVEYKNVAALRQWCNENPDAKINNTSNNLLKDKIYLQTLQGDDCSRSRIIRNLTKEVLVEKVADDD